MKICCLASGSNGNSTYIKAGETEILVDAGPKLEVIEKRLREIGEDPSKISAIFITHEHFDHIKGAENFSKKYGTKVFVHLFALSAAMQFLKKVNENVFPFSSEDFFFGELTVSPFSVPHDSMFCVGFSFYHQQTKFSIATDLGKFSIDTLKKMEKSDLVFLESNHDEKMLSDGAYPVALKRRIRSTLGHLSNKEAAEASLQLAKTGTKNFLLCHLSENNNSEKLAIDEVESMLKNFFESKFDLKTANRHGIGPVYEI